MCINKHIMKGPLFFPLCEQSWIPATPPARAQASRECQIEKKSISLNPVTFGQGQRFS